MSAAANAIRLAQWSLRSITPSLVIDGVWGDATKEAFRQAPAELIGYISSILPPSLLGAKVGMALFSSWVNEALVDAEISKVSAITGIPSKTLRFFVDHEAAKQSISSPSGEKKVQFNAASRSPSGLHYGLMQISQIAWVEATTMGKKIGVKLDSFASWRDTYANVLACALYIKVNIGYVNKNNPSAKLDEKTITPELAYALHNQGHTVWKRLKNGSPLRYPDQSSKALETIRIARAQVKQ